jgi:2'-5' RNA ligase
MPSRRKTIGDNDAMRLFVASLLPPHDRAFYDMAVEGLVARARGIVRAIPRDSARVTLAFLGDLPDPDIDTVTTAVARALQGRLTIDARLGAPALLRTRRLPRLVMAPLAAGAAPVAGLSGAIVAALRQLPPFAALPDPKAAHVTLARVRPRATPRDGDHLEAALREMDVRPRDLRLMRVQLVASTLTPDGPQYRTLEAWSLHDTSRSP